MLSFSTPKLQQEWRGGLLWVGTRAGADPPSPRTCSPPWHWPRTKHWQPGTGSSHQGRVVWHNQESQSHVQRGGKDTARGTAGVEMGNGAEIFQTGAHRAPESSRAGSSQPKGSETQGPAPAAPRMSMGMGHHQSQPGGLQFPRKKVALLNYQPVENVYPVPLERRETHKIWARFDKIPSVSVNHSRVD